MATLTLPLARPLIPLPLGHTPRLVRVRDMATSPHATTVYSEKRIVGYTPAQMCGVVADVASYSQFVPYCRRSVVTIQKPKMLSANLLVGFPALINLSYTSHVTILAPNLVTAVCGDVKMFKHLKTVWKFTPSSDKGCEIDFAVSFAFTNPSHSYIARLFLDSVVRENVQAFIGRAESLYGPPSIPSKTLSVLVQRQPPQEKKLSQ